MQIFSIRDSKAGIFNQPFFQLTPEAAIRHLHRMTRDDQSMICHFPEDYDLYHVGKYDEQNGVIVPLDSPQHIAKAIHFKGDN